MHCIGELADQLLVAQVFGGVQKHWGVADCVPGECQMWSLHDQRLREIRLMRYLTLLGSQEVIEATSVSALVF